MFSFVPVPGSSSEYAGAYRVGTCDAAGDHLTAFHATGLNAAANPQEVTWLSQVPLDKGEDPRCFLWQEMPTCLTWTQLDGLFRLIRFESKGMRSVDLDSGVTSQIGGKNWIAVPAEDSKLYLVVSLEPLKVLRYDGEQDNVGKLSWHHVDSGMGSFTWRGGTPAAFFDTGGSRGYVGLGHHSVSASNHKVMAYVFSPDLHKVEFLNTDSFLLPREGPDGVWDPLSIWQVGAESRTGLPQFGVVVNYWGDVRHKLQRTHLATFTVSAAGNAPVH